MRNSPLRGLIREGNSQGLNPQALADKRARDLAAAKTKKRKYRKAENQSDETPEQSSNYDLHHKPDGSVVKMKKENNRNVWKWHERT